VHRLIHGYEDENDSFQKQANNRQRYLSPSTDDSQQKVYYIHSQLLSDLMPSMSGLTPERESFKTTAKTPCIVTKLPTRLLRMLQIYPPAELFCWESPPCVSGLDALEKEDVMSLLCLYTEKSVIILQISLPLNDQLGSSVVAGVIRNLFEPIQSFLTDREDMDVIVRIRPAPTCFDDNSIVWAPIGSFVVMLENSVTRHTTIALYHSSSGIAIPSQSTPTGASTSNFLASVFDPNSVTMFKDLDHARKVTVLTEYRADTLSENAESLERVVDFCFAGTHRCSRRSNSEDDQQYGDLSFFSAISLFLVKQSGEILVLTPVVFDGAVAPRILIAQATEFLRQQICEMGHRRNSAQYRQYKAAECYLRDLFHPIAGTSSSRSAIAKSLSESHYERARIITASTENASNWPIQQPRTLVTFSSTLSDQIDGKDLKQHVAIQSVGLRGGNGFVGVVHTCPWGMFHFVLVSPTALIPRFIFETTTDRYDIDAAITKLVSIVDRIHAINSDRSSQVGDEKMKRIQESSRQRRKLSFPSVQLICDEFNENLFHFVSAGNVITIFNNALQIVAQNLTQAAGISSHEAGLAEEKRAMACCSLNVLSQDSTDRTIQGAWVTANANTGHKIVISLSDGNIEYVDVTYVQYLYELEQSISAATVNNANYLASGDGKRKSKAADISDTDVSRIHRNLDEETAPLYKVIEPLVRRVNQGLSENIARLVSTNNPDHEMKVSSEELSASFCIKEQCDQFLVLPLLELQQTVSTHRRHLQEIVACSQMEQIREMKQSVSNMRCRMLALTEKIDVAVANSKRLKERSIYALQACQGLIPQVTTAEHNFYRQIYVLQAKCTTYNAAITDVLRTMEHHRQLAQRKPLPRDTATNPTTDQTSLSSTLASPTRGPILSAHEMLRNNETTLKAIRNRMEKLGDNVITEVR
jgi:hypothetical protein